MSNFVYAQHSSQDPSYLNLNLGDFTGYTLIIDKRYEGPSEVAEEISPHSETIWTNWEFEIGSDRMFVRDYTWVISKVYRFSTAQGAKSELDYRHDATSEHRLSMSDKIGDESFATGGLLDGGELYAVYFRKANVNVMVSTDSFAAAKEYARIIESRIEIPLNVDNYLLILVGVGSIGAIIIVLSILLNRRRIGKATISEELAASDVPKKCMHIQRFF